MIYSAIKCFSIHNVCDIEIFMPKIYICVYDQMILCFDYTMVGKYW